MAFLSNAADTYKLILQFFDQEAVLSSDSAKYIQLFKQMYPRFERNNDFPLRQSPLHFQIESGVHNRSSTPKLILGNVVKSLSGIHMDDGYIYESILNAILSRVRSHFLIHAGVVSWNGQGLLLVADSAHGKTTLVLELIRRGFKFLSDEMAALGRKDHMVHPFLRSLRIRSGSLELTGYQRAAIDAPAWLDKLLLDIEKIKKNCVGSAVPVQHIVILQDPGIKESKRNIAKDRKVIAVVDRIEDAFVSRIRKMENVTALSIDSNRPYPVLEIITSRPTTLLFEIEALCDSCGILLLNYIRKEVSRPEFDASPRMITISQTEAAREMLRRFLGGHRSALLQDEFGGSSLKLFIELADTIKAASCHRLYVGCLSEMADLVCDLMLRN